MAAQRENFSDELFYDDDRDYSTNLCKRQVTNKVKGHGEKNLRKSDKKEHENEKAT